VHGFKMGVGCGVWSWAIIGVGVIDRGKVPYVHIDRVGKV